jgi:hypothetical protein
VRLRQRGGPASLCQAAVFGALVVLSLNSKEMAVSLAPMALLFDVLFHPPRGKRPSEVARWAFTEAGLAVAGCLLTAGWLVGRVFGPDSVSAQAGYRLAISLTRYFEGTAHFFDQLFYSAGTRTGAGAFLILAGLLAAALLVRSRALVWCWLLFVCGILPLAFLTSPRGLDAAVIPLAGLWMYAATLAVRLREALVSLAGRSASAPWGRRLAAASRVVLFVTVALLLLRIHPGSEPVYQAWVRHHYGRISFVTAQFRELYPVLPRGSRVLIVKDPFGDHTWETFYILQLLYRDQTLVVNQLGMMHPKPDRAALASYDHIFSFENGRLVELTPAREP